MDYRAEFDLLNTIIIGISKDTIKANKKFKENNNIEFDLLSDVETSVCNEFNVLAEKSLFGKSYIGIIRSTFIFDEHGDLMKSFKNVKLKGHVEEVLNILK